MERRKRRLGILGYDDLLTRLAAALEDPDAPARQRMRRRWSVVMVDEFQDTDPVQWKVIDAAFNGHSTLVLIGDPKQAIYAFRGGDIATYLPAADTAGERRTLGTNWRSDQPLVDTLQVVLGGARLGHEDIVVREVAAHHQGSRLAGAPSDAPFRLRVARREQFGVGRPQDHHHRRAARPHRPRPRRRHRSAARVRCDVRRAAGAGRRRRGDRRGAQGRAGLPRGAGRGRHPGGLLRRPRHLLLAGRQGLAVPARGVRATAPLRAGAGGGDHDVLRRDRGQPARRRGRADRPDRTDAARLGRPPAGARCGRGVRGRAGRRDGGAGAGLAWRRARHDRPRAPRPAAARDRAPRAVRAARAARLAA